MCVCRRQTYTFSSSLALKFSKCFRWRCRINKNTHCCEIQGKKNCIYHRQIVAGSSTLCPSSLSTIPADKVEVLGASANTVKGKGLCTAPRFVSQKILAVRSYKRGWIPPPPSCFLSVCVYVYAFLVTNLLLLRLSRNCYDFYCEKMSNIPPMYFFVGSQV